MRHTARHGLSSQRGQSAPRPDRPAGQTVRHGWHAAQTTWRSAAEAVATVRRSPSRLTEQEVCVARRLCAARCTHVIRCGSRLEQRGTERLPADLVADLNHRAVEREQRHVNPYSAPHPHRRELSPSRPRTRRAYTVAMIAGGMRMPRLTNTVERRSGSGAASPMAAKYGSSACWNRKWLAELASSTYLRRMFVRTERDR
jgi:hypothetical protein